MTDADNCIQRAAEIEKLKGQIFDIEKRLQTLEERMEPRITITMDGNNISPRPGSPS